jgi:hypothetical protein
MTMDLLDNNIDPNIIELQKRSLLSSNYTYVSDEEAIKILLNMQNK